VLSRFHLIPECNERTDGRTQTDGFAIPISRIRMLTHDKKPRLLFLIYLLSSARILSTPQHNSNHKSCWCCSPCTTETVTVRVLIVWEPLSYYILHNKHIRRPTFNNCAPSHTELIRPSELLSNSRTWPCLWDNTMFTSQDNYKPVADSVFGAVGGSGWRIPRICICSYWLICELLPPSATATYRCVYVCQSINQSINNLCYNATNTHQTM